MGLKNAGADPSAFLDDLLAKGFRIQEIDERRHEIRDVDASELIGRLTYQSQAFTNLLCEREAAGAS